MPEPKAQHPVDEAPPSVQMRGQKLPMRKRRLIFIGALVAFIILFLRIMPAGTRVALLVSLFETRYVLTGLIIFVLVTLSLLWSAGQKFDARLFLFINLRGYHSLWIDRLMTLVTQLGSFPFAAVMIGVEILLNHRRQAIVMVMGQITLWIVVEMVKALTDRSRPFTMLSGARVVGWRALGMSFPSGHTSQAFFLATLVTHNYLLPVWASILVYALAVSVGFTRIYVGAHYPRDVVAGALLGSLWGVISILVDNYLIHLTV